MRLIALLRTPLGSPSWLTGCPCDGDSGDPKGIEAVGDGGTAVVTPAVPPSPAPPSPAPSAASTSCVGLAEVAPCTNDSLPAGVCQQQGRALSSGVAQHGIHPDVNSSPSVDGARNSFDTPFQRLASPGGP